MIFIIFQLLQSDYFIYFDIFSTLKLLRGIINESYCTST
ncbi:hypothetical protein B4117_3801 [Bacillus mycoides]|nr:hypothetical protein B4117_3801 [Bacillus mycoides]